MISVVPPPLPVTESAYKACLRFVVSLLPAFTAWAFASSFLKARLAFIWREAGLASSRAQWLISFSDGFQQSFWVIVLGFILLFAILELRVRAWPPYRRAVLFSATVLLDAVVFAWILALATSALLAVPFLTRTR